MITLAPQVNGAVRKSFDGPPLRVRVAKNLKKVQISGLDLSRELYFSKSVKKFKGRKRIQFKCHNFISKNNQKMGKKPLMLASLTSSTHLLSLGKDKYKGKLNLITSVDHQSCDVIHETNIDDYISTLLAKEMNASWPIEVLKAQAIAARSYALHKMESQEVSKGHGFESHYDLESSEKHQVSGSFFDATAKTTIAARETKGMVLKGEKSSKVGPIFFHAKCGGKTLMPHQVWKNRIFPYRSINCEHCKGRGGKDWKKSISIRRFKKFLGWLVKQKGLKLEKGSLKERLRVVPDHLNHSRLRVYLGERVITFEKSMLRRYFGRVIFPSNRLSLKVTKNSLQVMGEGLGHGVGMCQIGALYMAKSGKSFKEILHFYYPKHRLEKVY